MRLELKIFDTPESMMVIFLDVTTNIDKRVEDVCIELLTPSIVNRITFEISEHNLKPNMIEKELDKSSVRKCKTYLIDINRCVIFKWYLVRK